MDVYCKSCGFQLELGEDEPICPKCNQSDFAIESDCNWHALSELFARGNGWGGVECKLIRWFQKNSNLDKWKVIKEKIIYPELFGPPTMDILVKAEAAERVIYWLTKAGPIKWWETNLKRPDNNILKKHKALPPSWKLCWTVFPVLRKYAIKYFRYWDRRASGNDTLN